MVQAIPTHSSNLPVSLSTQAISGKNLNVIQNDVFSPFFEALPRHLLESSSATHCLYKNKTNQIRQYDPIKDKLESPSLPKPRFASYNEFLKEYKKNNWEEQGTLLVLSRHGTSLFNRVRLINGTNHSPLLEDGKLEASQLAKTLAALPISTIYSSPIERAYQSALIYLDVVGLALPIFVDQDLREFERGVLAGRPRKMTSQEVDHLFKSFSDPKYQVEFRKKYAVSESEMQQVFKEAIKHRKILKSYAEQEGLTEDDFVQLIQNCENSLSCRPPLGESWQDGIDQADRFISEEINRHQSGAILMFGHGGSHRMMIWKLLGHKVKSIDQLYQIKQGISNINILYKPKNSEAWELMVLNSNRFGDRDT
ncbi:hypothetical protein BVY03_01050, partial [bacterium K02(2017)]